jgi:hypothetical protein
VGASLAAFYTHCAGNDFKAGLQVLGDVSLGDAMQATAACGHGAIWHDGSQIQCALEWTKPVPKALFDWRTASNWREDRDWLGEIHGMRVAFRDSTSNGAAGEVLVYADGYSSANASLFERVDLDRSISPARAWREGRKALVRRENGGRSVSFRTPADGLDVSAVQFGARVAIVPPLLSLARASAGIENRIMAGGLVAGVRLDDDVEIVSGVTHGLRIGTPFRGVLAVQVSAAGAAIGWTRDLYFSAPMAPADAPEAGDKVVFGELGTEAQDYEIASLRPLASFEVEVTATPYLGPLIAAVEGETPPVGLQGALNTANSPVPAPRIDAASPNGEGGVLVLFALMPQRGNPVDAVTVRRRVQLEADGADAAIWGQWEDLPSLAASARMVTIPPPNMAAGGVNAPSRALVMQIELAAVARASTSLPASVTVDLTRQLIPTVAGEVAPQPVNILVGMGPLSTEAPNGGYMGLGYTGPGGFSVVSLSDVPLSLACWQAEVTAEGGYKQQAFPTFTVAAGEVLSARYSVEQAGTWASGGAQAGIRWLSSTGSVIGLAELPEWSAGTQVANSPTGVREVIVDGLPAAPSGTVKGQFFIVSTGKGSGFARFWRGKVNRGAVSSGYSDEADQGYLFGAVSGSSIIDANGDIIPREGLENQFVPRIEGLTSVNINADFTNSTLEGQLPWFIALRLMQGTLDIGAGLSWSMVVRGAATANISNLGVITLLSASGEADIEVSVPFSGTPYRHNLHIGRTTASPPPPPPSPPPPPAVVGGPSPVTTSLAAQVTQTQAVGWQDITPVLSIRSGLSPALVRAEFMASYDTSRTGFDAYDLVNIEIQMRPIGGAWTTIASIVDGSLPVTNPPASGGDEPWVMNYAFGGNAGSFSNPYEPEFGESAYSGNFLLRADVSGLTAVTDYEFRARGSLSDASTSGFAITFYAAFFTVKRI